MCDRCSSSHGLAAALAAVIEALRNADRCAADILTVEQAAALLHCSVDTLRRIEPAELPYSRVGKTNLYLRDDLIAFVRKRRIRQPPSISRQDASDAVDALIQSVLHTDVVDAREPRKRRLT